MYQRFWYTHCLSFLSCFSVSVSLASLSLYLGKIKWKKRETEFTWSSRFFFWKIVSEEFEKTLVFSFFFFLFFFFFFFSFFLFFSFLFLFLFSFLFLFLFPFCHFYSYLIFWNRFTFALSGVFFSCRIKLLNVITHHTSHWHRFVNKKERGERRERERVHLCVGYCVVMCWVLRVWIIVRWWNRRGEGWMILKLKNKEMIKRRRGIPKDWARFYCRYFTEEAWLVRGQHNTTAGSILVSWDNLTCCVCASNDLLLWAAGTYDRQTTGLLWDDCLI